MVSFMHVGGEGSDGDNCHENNETGDVSGDGGGNNAGDVDTNMTLFLYS